MLFKRKGTFLTRNPHNPRTLHIDLLEPSKKNIPEFTKIFKHDLHPDHK
jgi:hypothetical protein